MAELEKLDSPIEQLWWLSELEAVGITDKSECVSGDEINEITAKYTARIQPGMMEIPLAMLTNDTTTAQKSLTKPPSLLYNILAVMCVSPNLLIYANL